MNPISTLTLTLILIIPNCKANNETLKNEIYMISDIYDVLYNISHIMIDKLKLMNDELDEIKSEQLFISQFSNNERNSDKLIYNKNIHIINENNKKINNLIDKYNSIENTILDVYRKLYKPIHLIYIWNLISMSILIIIVLLVIYIGFK